MGFKGPEELEQQQMDEETICFMSIRLIQNLLEPKCSRFLFIYLIQNKIRKVTACRIVTW